VSNRDEQVSSLSKTVSEREGQIAGFNREISSINHSIAERDRHIARLNHAMAERDTIIHAMQSSRSWRMTGPFRATGAHLRRGLKSFRHGIWKRLKSVYKALPLSGHYGWHLKSVFYGTFGWFFRDVASYKSWRSLRENLVSRTAVPQPQSSKVVETVSFEAFSVPAVDDPLVSVIIPVCKNIEFTYPCLKSIAENLPEHPFEVIIVDDCMQGATDTVLSGIKGIRVIKNEQNLGFLRSCNKAARAARGRYLLLLNNDTKVRPRWLDELVETFDAAPDAGLVGSKLVYPDGKLQEAGGIIGSDGSGWNYGRYDDSEKPEYNYLREVDFCSGASIMVPKDLFLSLGGFDDRYAPAYYEDVDLAFTVRKAGRKVLYQPLSQVVHYEGVSSGTDLSSGVKSYQRMNQGKFRQKWGDVLVRHGMPGIDPRAASGRWTAKRLLVVDATTPTPDQDAGSIDVVSYFTIFRALGYGITFIPEDNFLRYDKYTEALQRMGVECLYAPYDRSVRAHIREHGGRYDLVMLYRANHAAKHIDDIRSHCPQATVVFNTVDLHYLREERQAAVERSSELARKAVATKATELAVMRKADCTIVLNTAEKEILAREVAVRRKHIAVMPLIIPVPGRSASFEERRDVVFIGGYNHQPNVDAVSFFARDIWPQVRRRLPDARFVIVGSNPPPEILSLQGDGIVIAGFVADLAKLFGACRLSVAPIRYGAGMKGKVLTSLSYGVPCVATAIAAEGGDYRHDENILVADDPESFADSVVRVYENEQLWERLSKNGLLFVEQNYSLAAGHDRMQALLKELSISKNSVHPGK